MSDAGGLSVPKKSKRLEFIDLLRGWAVIVMIETHVVNATLAPELTSAAWFQWVKFINGLVAPSFLFASGLAYAVTTRRKISDYLSFGPPLFKQVRRLLFVVMIGYLLHLPKFNVLQIIRETTEGDWRTFFQADVLQCIGVSLLLIQGLLLMLKEERRLYHTVLGLSVVIIFVTPVMWGIDFHGILPWWIAGYMNGIHFKHFPGFPLFPWTAFLFAGAVFGYFYLKSRDTAAEPAAKYNEPVMMRRSLYIAPFILGFAVAIEPLAARLYPTYDYWLFSPSFVLLRLAIVIALCALMFFYEKRFGVSSRSVVTLIGRESLLVYAVHLFLIYGNFGAFNFSRTVGRTLGYLEAAIASVILMLLMYGLALFWDYLRKQQLQWKRRVELVVFVSFLAVFFFGPGE